LIGNESRIKNTLSAAKSSKNVPLQQNFQESHEEKDGEGNTMDTIRVRIWRALASGEELSLKELGAIVGERRLGELKSHLTHVEKQAKTIKNKKDQWKERRGLSNINDRKLHKQRVQIRRGGKNEIFVKFE